MREPIVAGEPPTPLQRVLVVANTGNGVSSALDWRRFTFINVDLTVHLERLPGGEWVCLDAVTLPGRTGMAAPTPSSSTRAAGSAEPCRRSWSASDELRRQGPPAGRDRQADRRRGGEGEDDG